MKANMDAIKEAKNLSKVHRAVTDVDLNQTPPTSGQELKTQAWRGIIKSSQRDTAPARLPLPRDGFKRWQRGGLRAKQPAARYDYHDIEKSPEDLRQALDKGKGEVI